MQGSLVQALVRGDPTCHGAAKAAHCNKEQPLLAATRESPRSNEDPMQPKKKKKIIIRSIYWKPIVNAA